MAAACYFDLVRKMKSAYNHRLRLGESARQRGMKRAARLFATTVPSVREGLRRHQQRGPSGLIEQSPAPHHQPRRTPAFIERPVVELRQSLPPSGPVGWSANSICLSAIALSNESGASMG